jgi:hypothetical protein
MVLRRVEYAMQTWTRERRMVGLSFCIVAMAWITAIGETLTISGVRSMEWMSE